MSRWIAPPTAGSPRPNLFPRSPPSSEASTSVYGSTFITTRTRQISSNASPWSLGATLWQARSIAARLGSWLTTNDYRPTISFPRQTRHLFSLTIAEPARNPCLNSGMFESTPFNRYLSGECGSIVANRRLVSSSFRTEDPLHLNLAPCVNQVVVYAIHTGLPAKFELLGSSQSLAVEIEVSVHKCRRREAFHHIQRAQMSLLSRNI